MDSMTLKDIHLPEPVSGWPPAPGWWLIAIMIAALIIGGFMLFRHWTRKTALKSARSLLIQLKGTNTSTPLATLTALSALLRRVAMSLDTRNDVASLHGEAWLAYLDRGLPDAPFSSGVGRCLASGHYQSQLPAELDLNALFALCERWLKHQRRSS